jgi:hypothetical protein
MLVPYLAVDIMPTCNSLSVSICSVQETGGINTQNAIKKPVNREDGLFTFLYTKYDKNTLQF